MDKLVQFFSVSFDYPVYFTENLFAEDNPVFQEAVSRLEPKRGHRVMFVVDENVALAHTRLVERIRRYFAARRDRLELLGEPLLVVGGEQAKEGLTRVMELVEEVNRLGVDRQSFMAVIGGGAVLDMACFAAAISHRGVRAVRIPTTVLAQSDSGVGVKCAVNVFGKKNFIGAFAPPFAVLNDVTFIETLSHRDKIAGIAEAVKVSLVRDREFFESIETDVERLARADPEALAHHIRRCCEHHVEHIGSSGDPFEFGSARPLDFGHWSAHKLETLSRYRLRHGEAVAVGIALDSVYSMKAGYLAEAQLNRVLRLLSRLGFELWDDLLLSTGSRDTFRLLEGLDEFREHLGGALHISLLRDIGDSFEVNEIDRRLMIDSIHGLREWLTEHEGQQQVSPHLLHQHPPR